MTVRVTPVGDVHVGTDTAGRLAASLRTVEDCADSLLIAGDLTRVGSDEDAACVIAEMDTVGVPTIAVLGNHDHHADRTEHVVRMWEDAGIRVLEGQTTVVDVGATTVGVAGVKGFGGGVVGRSAANFGESGKGAGLRPAGVRVRNVAQPVLGAPFRVHELN